MTRPLKVGLVGCGQIAREHLRAYQQSGAVTIAGVCDANRRAAESLAESLQVPVATSVDQLVRDVQPDLVSVCTPPGAHLENCRPFIEQKIPILCEKPLAANRPDAEALATAIHESGTLFMVAFCHRFHPPIVELKKLLDAGVLGRPLFFRNIFAGYFPLAGNHRADPALSGGGCLMDNGAHSVDLFRFLIGEPTAVQAMTGNVTQAVTVEDFQMIHLATDGKAFGEICSSYSLPVGANYVEIYAEKGTAVVSYWNPGTPAFSYRLSGAEKAVVVDCPEQPDRFALEVAHFLDCVRTGKPPTITVDDGLRVNQIVAAAYESARTGCRISL